MSSLKISKNYIIKNRRPAYQQLRKNTKINRIFTLDSILRRHIVYYVILNILPQTHT